MSHYIYSPRNENVNLLVRIKFLNLFLHSLHINKNWKNYRSEQNFTGLEIEGLYSLWGLHLEIWLVLRRRASTHCEDCLETEGQYSLWGRSWDGGPVLIVRTASRNFKYMYQIMFMSKSMDKFFKHPGFQTLPFSSGSFISTSSVGSFWSTSVSSTSSVGEGLFSTVFSEVSSFVSNVSL